MSQVGSVDAPPRWTWKDRSLLGAMLLLFIVGTPGLGPETREAPSAAVTALMFCLFILPSVVAFAASWKWPTAAARAGVVAGATLIIMGALDLAGVLISRPPPGMVIVDSLIVGLGAVIGWRTWALLHPRAVPA
jgi:hypothetical protein